MAEISAMQKMSDEIITYQVSPYLDRFTKNSCRLINKKLSKLIIPQSILNEKYALACITNNTNSIVEWRKKGALHLHEEVYNLFVNNKKKLARALWLNHIKGVGSFCVKSAFFHGIQLNSNPFITFLLEKSKPTYKSDVIKYSLIESRKLKRNEISLTLQQYIDAYDASKQQYCYGIGYYSGTQRAPYYP